MRTEPEREHLRKLLQDQGVGSTSPRAHRAMDCFKDGETAEMCVEVAVAYETIARNRWIETALDPWCKRHGLTREQGLSVAFDDESFNPADPKNDRPTMRDLFAWSGQQTDFALKLMRDAAAARGGEPPSTDQLLNAWLRVPDDAQAEPGPSP